MYIGLFKRPRIVRSYGKQELSGGHAYAPYKDSEKRLDVQQLSPNEMQALPEGDRTVKRVKTYGPDRLTAADEYSGTPGDRLHYQGYWYECKSSVLADNTPIGQYRSEFVILPAHEQDKQPIGEGMWEP